MSVPASDHLAENLAALAVNFPDLAESLGAAAEPSGAELQATRDGDWTARIALAEGSAVTLHSRYNPRDEARKLAGEIHPDTAEGFLVMGFGLGYHVEAIAAAMNSESEIVVIEENPGLVRLAARVRDLRHVFGDKRIVWMVGLKRRELYDVMRMRQTSMLSTALRYVWHEPSARLNPAYYTEARGAVRDFILSGEMVITSDFMLARKSLVNQMKNLPGYASVPTLAELRPLYQGKPGIIVSAGPSLRRNIDKLRAARGKAVLVACDIVLKPLLERGIVPDFTAVVDFQGQTKKFFETLPKRVDTRLVAIGPAFHETVALFPGAVTFAGDPVLNALLGDAARDMGGAHGGSNVGHFCYVIACHLGLEPIALVGQDLAFPLNIIHMPGTPKHEEWQNERNRFYTLETRELEDLLRKRHELLMVPAQDGGEIFTDHSMYHYIRDLEGAISDYKRKTFDCTEGGSKKDGAEPRKLDDFLAECPPDNTPPAGAGPLEPSRERLEVVAKKLDERMLELLEIKAAIEQKLRAHKRISDALDAGEPPERYIRSAVEFGERIEKHDQMLAVLKSLASSAVFGAGVAYRSMKAVGDDEDKKLRAQLKRDDDYIRELSAAVDFFEPLLREARRSCQARAESVGRGAQ